MDRPGEKLRRVRERLKLTYRDVERASQELAARRDSSDFHISLSRLADIENRGSVPSIFRLYALSAIYHLDLHEVMRWYGVPVEQLPADALRVKLAETHRIEVTAHAHIAMPASGDPNIDMRETTFLSRWRPQWGGFPIHFMDGADHRQPRYGLVGLDDWSMFPILRPGSLVLIDESRRKIARGGWNNEFDRPIYFLEHRHGYLCGWCTQEDGTLTVQPHPASEKAPTLFKYPPDIDVVGQVVGMAMLLDAQNGQGVKGGARLKRAATALREAEKESNPAAD
jgi:transcriptional regulator with XRE-family HTH domain